MHLGLGLGLGGLLTVGQVTVTVSSSRVEGGSRRTSECSMCVQCVFNGCSINNTKFSAARQFLRRHVVVLMPIV